MKKLELKIGAKDGEGNRIEFTGSEKREMKRRVSLLNTEEFKVSAHFPKLDNVTKCGIVVEV